MRKLGSIQLDVLKSLIRYGGYPGGWYWTNHSTTERHLNRLVKRGLVAVTASKFGDFWKATDLGREVAGKL